MDVGIAADTGSDTAIGAIFHVDCQAGSSVGYGLRKKGSTDNRLQTLRANMMNLGLVGVDATETAQQQIAANTVDLFLVGYVTSGAVFFTNALDKSTATPGSYQPVDITNDVGAGVANGAFVEIQPSDGTRRTDRDPAQRARATTTTPRSRTSSRSSGSTPETSSSRRSSRPRWTSTSPATRSRTAAAPSA